MSRASGNMKAEAPPELVEIGLMERFNWTPMEIDQIPLGRLQKIFIAMEQREQSKEAAKEVESQRNTKQTQKRGR